MALNNNNNDTSCKCTTPEYEIILNEQGPQGRQGNQGEPGFTPIISVKDNTASNYTLNILTQDGQITTPNLKANIPTGGSSGMVLTKNSSVDGDASFTPLPVATEEIEGIARLATENDFEATEDSAVSSTSIVTPQLFNTELAKQVNTFIVAGENITTSVDDTGKVTINSTGGSGGTSDYTELTNKPQINGHELTGNQDGNALGLANESEIEELGNELNQLANDVTNLDTNKQDKLIAGNNITIEGNVISSTGGGTIDAYTKAETDELLDDKQDKLTAVSPLNIDYEIRSNLNGFEYTTDGTGVYATDDNKYLKIQNDTNMNSFCQIPFGETNNSCITINEDGSNTWTNYIDIPYKLNQIAKIPKAPYDSNYSLDYIYSTALLGYVDNNNNFFPIIGSSYLSLISTENKNLYLYSNAYYTNDSIIQYNPSRDTTSRQYKNPNYAYIQLYEDPDTGSFSFQRYSNYGASNNNPLAQTCKYNITKQEYINRLKEINTIRIFPTSTSVMNGRTANTAYPVNNIKLFDTGVELFSYNDNFTTLESSTNYFDLSGQVAENYLSLKIDNNTIKVNSNGQLYSTITLPDNITTQGNTFNGVNQLIKTDNSGHVILNGIIKSLNSNGIQSDRFAATGNQQVLGFGLSGSRVDVGWQDNYGLNLICNTLTLNDNAPNTAGGLVQIDASGKLPAIDGSQLTNLPITDSINTLLKVDVTGLNTTISTGATQNLLDLISLTSSSTNIITTANIDVSNYNLTGGILKLPYLPTVNNKYTNAYCDYSMDVRITGTIGGSVNTAREFNIELQRASDNSIVETHNVTKTNTNDLTGKGVVFSTYTNTSSDPFITNGLKLVLNNTSGQTVTITGVTLLVKGRTY